MESYDEVWQAVLEYCKVRVTETAYNLWISTLKLDNFDTSGFTISGLPTANLMFPSSMHVDVVLPQYKDLLEEAFSEVMGFKCAIGCFVIDKNLRYKMGEGNYNNQEHLEAYKNEQFTFDNFIVGSSNRFAYVAAKAVASDPGSVSNYENYRSYNPLFIYGNSGLGKTHLLNAICREIEINFPEMKILYIRAEDFANEFFQSLQYKTTDEFHTKYRNNVDVFLIDDIQFIANKEALIEEFFHTFDSYVFNGKQVVISSDRPPKDIQSITDRLKSRFEDGLLADIQPPEYDTRCEIIKRKAKLLNFDIPETVVNYIAEKIKTNIRQLEGVTKKLCAMCEINKHEPTIALVQSIIKVIAEEKIPLPVTIQRIVEEVSRTTGVSVEDIYGRVQKANISHARKITFYIIRNVTNMSYEDIGEHFGKHHSTVMYNINQIAQELEKDSKLNRQVTDIINNIKNEQ